MKNLSTNLRTMIVAGGAIFMAIAAPLETDRMLGYGFDVISVASAAEEGHAGHQSGKGTKAGGGKMQGGGQGGPQAGGSGSGKGSKSLESSVLKPKVAEDSDRPAWAGVKGGKAGAGTKPPGAGTMKGDLYGDLFVLIRDPVSGVALTELIGGKTYPLVQAYDVNGVLLPGVSIPRDAEGNLVLTDAGGTVIYTTKEVEFGRLSVGRAPTKVLDHSLTEALTKLAEASASSTDNIVLTLDAGGRLVIVTDGVAKAIDSPLENLALYVAIANLTGTNRTISDGTTTWTVPDSINIDLLKASLLAAAADKTGSITLDTVMYTNPVLKVTDELSSFSYDRYTTYKDVFVTILVPNADGTVWTATKVSVYDAVFKSTNLVTPNGATDFAQAADDALQVIEFIHEYQVPVMPAP